MWRDEHTGLYHTHYRLYDPQHVRWLTPDPAGYRDGQNLYRFYAGPNGVDVLGLDLKGQSGYYSTDDLFDLYALFEEGKNSEATFKALLEDLNLYNDFGALPSGSNKKEEMLEVIELLINMSIADDESTLMEEIEKSEKIRQDNQSDGMKALAITGKTLSPLPKIANATAEEVLTSFIPVGKIVTWGKRIKAVAAIMRGGGKVLSYTASKLALFKSRVSKSIADRWNKFKFKKVLLHGTGPTEGVIEVSDLRKSAKLFQNLNSTDFTKKNNFSGIPYIYDPQTKRMFFGIPTAPKPGLSPHEQLLHFSGLKNPNIVAGEFGVSEKGVFLFDELSGHFHKNWNSVNRKEFTKFLGKYLNNFKKE